jgi:hypothetical protein
MNWLSKPGRPKYSGKQRARATNRENAGAFNRWIKNEAPRASSFIDQAADPRWRRNTIRCSYYAIMAPEHEDCKWIAPIYQQLTGLNEKRISKSQRGRMGQLGKRGAL